MNKKETKKKKDNTESDYISEYVEWQEHINVSGYYTGSKIPPYINRPGKPKMAGLIYIISGLVFLIVSIYLLISSILEFSQPNLGEKVFGCIIFILMLLFSIILILAGVRLIMNASKFKKNKVRK